MKAQFLVLLIPLEVARVWIARIYNTFIHVSYYRHTNLLICPPPLHAPHGEPHPHPLSSQATRPRVLVAVDQDRVVDRQVPYPPLDRDPSAACSLAPHAWPLTGQAPPVRFWLPSPAHTRRQLGRPAMQTFRSRRVGPFPFLFKIRNFKPVMFVVGFKS
jgi:hypothetical protein